MSGRLPGWSIIAGLAVLFGLVGGGLWIIVRGIADQGDARESVTARTRAAAELDAALARFAAGPGDPAARAAALEAVVDTDPSYAPAHRELGRWRLAAADTAAAESSLRQALILEPFDAPAMLLLGGILGARGRREDALGWYEKAVLYARDDSVLAAARAGVASAGS